MSEEVEIPKPKITTVHVWLEGLTPVMTQRVSDYTIEQMDGESGSNPPQPSDEEEMRNGCYAFEENEEGNLVRLTSDEELHEMDLGEVEYGIKAIAFKKAMREAAHRALDYQGGTEVDATVHVQPNISNFVLLDTGMPEMDSRYVNLDPGARIAHRPKFFPWSAEFDLRFQESKFSLEQVLELLNVAGTAQGVGSFRVENDGTFGQFELTRVTVDN